MSLRTFRGGVHPDDGKALSKNAAIKRIDPGEELVYLLSQHIGAPSVPVVNVGDRVLTGQTIASAGGFVSADIASSVSGTVKAIEPRTNQNGDVVMAIVVENDFRYETTGSFGKKREMSDMTPDEIKKAVKDAGIVGMGGAGFPTPVKLSVKEGIVIDHIICNGAECEPYITCDYRLMLERSSVAVKGMAALLKLFPKAKGVFAIEANKPDGIRAMQDAIEGKSAMSVVPLRQKYPQGGERMIIYAITGREVNSKMLPADAGCVVINMSTLVAIAEAVCDNIPLTRRIVTITGDAVATPSNFDVPIGTNFNELIAAAGGFKTEPEKIISGGPMMGAALYDTNIPVTKTSSCLLCMSHDEAAKYKPGECIRCGKCLTVCPEHLMPIKLKNAADAGEYDVFEKLYGLECIGCGCCTYICPAKRRLSQSITVAKRHVLAEKKKAAVKK